MVRTNPTLRSLAVLAILLAVCCAGTAFVRANLSHPIITGGRMPTARLVWSIPDSDVRSICISSSGRYVCTVSSDSRITCYDYSGAKLFSVVVPGANRAAVSPEGDCVLAYSQMNRANTTLTFLDAKGHVTWKMDVAGAVWAADGGNRDDEACFAVGTGKNHVYLISICGSAKHYRRWKAPGVVCSVSFYADCDSVSYGTWQQSSVSCSDLTGSKKWQLDADTASLQYVQTLGGSGKLFVCSKPNRIDADGQVWTADADGDVSNQLPLCAADSTCALASTDGDYICTGYTKCIRHSAKTTPERHAALYDRDGRQLWDKGSLLLPVVPILVTHDGYVLLSGSKNAVLAVSPSGEVKQICKLPAAVESSLSSRDGMRSVLRCADGKIRFLQAVP